jgi:hypothetical protein
MTRRYLAVLTVAALAGCQQLLGLDLGTPTSSTSSTSGSGGTSGSSSTGGAGGLASSSSSSSGGTGGASSTSTSTTSSSTSTSTSSTTSTSASSSSSGLPTMGVCKGSGTRVLTNTQADAFIDDFEETTGISPGWSSFNDVMPTPNAFLMTQVTPGAVSTAHSGNYMGTGAKTAAMGGYGVGAVYNTAIDPPAGIYCIDISVFTGVSFWAKAGTAGSTISLNFVLPTTNMASQNDAGMPTGGDCVMNCYNHPHVNFALTTAWVQYTAEFSQAGGGSTTVGNVIQELAWLSPDSNWDFTLDEIAFYAGTPPPGKVGP